MVSIDEYRAAARRILSGRAIKDDYRVADAYHAQQAREAQRRGR